MTNEKRIEIEKGIVRRYLEALKSSGHTFSIIDLESPDRSVRRTPNVNRIVEMIYEVDDERVEVHHTASRKNHFLYFVLGNAPGEVLCDYSCALEQILAPVAEFAERHA